MTAAVLPESHAAESGHRTRPMHRWSLALMVIGAVGLVAGIAVIDGLPVGAFHDDAMYVILARALASGQGYAYLNVPGTPAATHFPPGYPAVLALLSLLSPSFPANLIVFKVLNAVCLALSTVLVARLVRDRIGSEGWGLAIGAASALSVPLLILGSMILSEPLFLTLLLAALVASERFVDGEPSWRRALGLGAAIGVLTLVRSHGIVLVPALAVMLGARRRWRDAAVVSIAAVLCMLPWQLWAARHGGTMPAPMLGNYDSYTRWWLRGLSDLGPGMVPETVRRTGAELAGMLVVLFSPMRGTVAHGITYLALGGLLALGGWVAMRRAPVTLLFCAAYLALTLIWPFAPSRFVWGVWPLLLMLLGFGAWSAWSSAATWPRAARTAVITGFAWLGVGYAAYEWRAARGQWWSSIPRAATRRIEPAIQWTLANTSPSDVIAAEDEGAIFLYTGRRSVPLLSFTTAHYLRERTPADEVTEGLGPILDAYPVQVVLVGTDRTYAAARLLETRTPPRLALREEFPGGVAFTVLPK